MFHRFGRLTVGGDAQHRRQLDELMILGIDAVVGDHVDRMADALDAYYIRGVSHNISFLNALIAHPRFREGRLSTNFIAEEYPEVAEWINNWSMSDDELHELENIMFNEKGGEDNDAAVLEWLELHPDYVANIVG